MCRCARIRSCRLCAHCKDRVHVRADALHTHTFPLMSSSARLGLRCCDSILVSTALACSRHRPLQILQRPRVRRTLPRREVRVVHPRCAHLNLKHRGRACEHVSICVRPMRVMRAMNRRHRGDNSQTWATRWLDESATAQQGMHVASTVRSHKRTPTRAQRHTPALRREP